MSASRRLAAVRLLAVAGAVSLLAACSVPTGPAARADEDPAVRAEPTNVAPASEEAPPDTSAAGRSGYGIGHG
jgi:hypothetical protein